MMFGRVGRAWWRCKSRGGRGSTTSNFSRLDELLGDAAGTGWRWESREECLLQLWKGSEADWRWNWSSICGCSRRRLNAVKIDLRRLDGPLGVWWWCCKDGRCWCWVSACPLSRCERIGEEISAWTCTKVESRGGRSKMRFSRAVELLGGEWRLWWRLNVVENVQI